MLTEDNWFGWLLGGKRNFDPKVLRKLQSWTDAVKLIFSHSSVDLISFTTRLYFSPLALVLVTDSLYWLLQYIQMYSCFCNNEAAVLFVVVFYCVVLLVTFLPRTKIFYCFLSI